MNEKQLNYEFMSILGESHPGLTFEEYRDSCVFLLFYQYLCLRYEEKLEDAYKLEAMVRMAVRGKLQIPSFLRFIDAASPFIYHCSKCLRLTDLSFYRKLENVQQLEKQKSYARFIRKLIKKMDAWACEDLLLKQYPLLFADLMKEFARAKKETHVSEELLQLYRLFYRQTMKKPETIFVPEFQYGILIDAMARDTSGTEIFGYEEQEGFREIVEILCYMNGKSRESVHLYDKRTWEDAEESRPSFDSIGIFMPEGVEAGTLLFYGEQKERMLRETASTSKGEFPFLLSAFSLMSEGGVMAAVLPSALLYREGRESSIRRYIVEDLNCLDTVMLLPDFIFQSAGQKEVFLLFRKKRIVKDIMFFDCSEMESLGKEQYHSIEIAWKERRSVPGFCSRVEREEISKNDYNLNLPRYITKSIRTAKVDIDAKKKRIEEIDRELKEIEKRISIYKRDLNL
ncbi:MAG: SAM-dependent methyltransferase [Clostridiales bacterium]|nr:SAM-dependent methyltransferase [Clostridiales bacterium]